MDLTLGNAMVSIGGDLAPLMKAFVDAKAARDAFERDMASGSAGMLKFTGAANDAGTALDKEAQKTKEAGNATADAASKLDRLTTAERSATDASKQRSAALDTEAQKQAQISKMVEDSIAAMQRSNLAPIRTSGTLKAVTAGGYGDEPGTKSGVARAAASEGMLGAGSLTAAINGVKAEEAAVDKLGKTTKLTAMEMREMVSLIRDIGRGDFSRLAGTSTLLAQNFGLLEKVGYTLVFQLGSIAAAAAVLAVAAEQASSEVNRLDNELLLSGNRAGLTAGSYYDMAVKLSDATNTSVKSNETLISSLEKTGNFTADEMSRLVYGAQTLSRATGQSAEDIIKDFAKMGESPGKYAEQYRKAFPGTITPIEVDYIATLERRGQKEQAIAALVQDVMVGITNNTTENIGIMQRAWEGFQKAVSDGWENLKGIFKDAPLEQQIAGLQSRLAILDKEKATGGHDSLLGSIFGDAAENDRQYKLINAQLQTLVDKKNAQDRDTKAQAEATAANNRQGDALERTNSQYLKGVDSASRYHDAVKALNATLADDLKMSHDTPVATLLDAASKSQIASIRDLGSSYSEQVARIKKENLPDVYKADAKAAREAESAAKKAAREAEELEKRRQTSISNARDEADTLAAILPLYMNQALSLDDVNRAKAIQIALSKDKLTTDDAEGKQLALQIGRQYDLNAAIEGETKARNEAEEARKALTSRDRSVQADASVVGTSGNAEDAAAVANALAKTEEASKKQLALVADAEKAGTFTHAQAEAARTAITQKAVADRAAITAEGLKLQQDREALDTKKLRAEYNGTDKVTTTGADVHGLNQKLGGKFKQNDDLKQLESETAKQQKIAADAHKAGLTDEKTYQEQLTKIASDAAAERLKIKLAQANMEIDAGQSIADSLTSITQDMFGKQSAEYKIAFDLAKAFTIAKASLALYQDVAQALSVGFPANLPLIAQAFAQGATIVSAVTSLKFAAGGMIPGVGGPTQDNVPISASPGEFMINARAAAQWRPTLEAINAGRVLAPNMQMPANDGARAAPGVTIHNYAGASVSTAADHNGNLTVMIRQQMTKEAPGIIAKDMGRPNSPTSKALRRTTTAAPRRK